MRRYDLFSIDEEVAKAYYGKEALLNQLFFEAFHETDPDHLRQLEKQVNYITRPLSIFRMETLLNRSLKHQEGYQTSRNEHEQTVRSLREESTARVRIGERSISIWSSGSLSTESLVFEKLRQIDPYLLAVDRTRNRSGWLRPIKTALLIEG